MTDDLDPTTCMCGHGADMHDAGECWGRDVWFGEDRQCTCPWYEAAA